MEETKRKRMEAFEKDERELKYFENSFFTQLEFYKTRIEQLQSRIKEREILALQKSVMESQKPEIKKQRRIDIQLKKQQFYKVNRLLNQENSNSRRESEDAS